MNFSIASFSMKQPLSAADRGTLSGTIWTCPGEGPGQKALYLCSELYAFTMGKKSSSLSVLVAVVLACVLSGCTNGDASSAPTPVETKTQPSGDSIRIFGDQKAMVERSPTSSMVMKQFSGTGPSTVQVGPFPEGYKQVGATVACVGTGGWEVSLNQDGSGWGKCSLDVGSSVAYPVDDPAKDQAVEVKVDAGTQIWVTVFATK